MIYLVMYNFLRWKRFVKFPATKPASEGSGSYAKWHVKLLNVSYKELICSCCLLVCRFLTQNLWTWLDIRVGSSVTSGVKTQVSVWFTSSIERYRARSLWNFPRKDLNLLAWKIYIVVLLGSRSLKSYPSIPSPSLMLPNLH